MERVDFATLEAEAAAFDSLAATTPGIDAFCSSTCWTLPALHAFQTTAESFVWRDNLGWAAFALGESPTVGRYLLPLEAAWGLACPVVSDTPDATMHDLAAALTATDERWNVVLIAALKQFRHEVLDGETRPMLYVDFGDMSDAERLMFIKQCNDSELVDWYRDSVENLG